jgi:hypothetical protein
VGARSRARSSFSLFSIACSSKLAGCSYEHSRPAIRPRRPPVRTPKRKKRAAFVVRKGHTRR